MEVYVILKVNGQSVVRAGTLLRDNGNPKRKYVMVDGKKHTVKPDQILQSKLIAHEIAEFY